MNPDELVMWIFKHRRNKVFKKYTVKDIKHSIVSAIADNCCVVLQDQCNSSILGIVLARRDDERKLLYVENILTIRSGLMPVFVEAFVNRFPGWSIAAKRRGREVSYNTKNFLRHYGK